MKKFKWDIFISYAWEDKEDIAKPLANALFEKGVKVWFVDMVLTIGDSLRRSIDLGLSKSRFGIVILSPNFFKKEWSQKELDGLVSRDYDNKVILPIWHKITKKDVERFSLILSDKLSVSTENGLEYVVEQIIKAISFDLPKLKQYQTQFVSLFYEQERKISQFIPEELETYPNRFCGSLKIEESIIGVNNLLSINEIQIIDCFSLIEVLKIIREIISNLNSIEENMIKIFNKTDTYNDQSRKNELASKTYHFDFDAFNKKTNIFDGYFIEIRNYYCAFIPFKKGNHIENTTIFHKRKQIILQNLFVELITKLMGCQITYTPFFPSEEVPEWGGFGYMMNIKS